MCGVLLPNDIGTAMVTGNDGPRGWFVIDSIAPDGFPSATAAEQIQVQRASTNELGAHTIVITDNKKLAKGVADDVIVIPRNGPLSALLAVAPLQMIAYEMALAKGINPDKPRNLAKAVTTD